MMKFRISIAISIAAGMVFPQFAAAVSPTSQEMEETRRFAAIQFQGVLEAEGEVLFDSGPFFSFLYGGTASAEFLGSWDLKRASRPLDEKRTEHTLTYTDPETGLVIRCVGIEYREFPAVEWVLYFKNTGLKDTPILENIQALDATFRNLKNILTVHHAQGTDAAPSDFSSQTDAVAPGAEFKLFSHGKRGGKRGGGPSIESLPFFNVEMSGRGFLFGLGWTGPWAAGIRQAGDAGSFQVQAGMEETHLLLHPGEEIRSPRILVLFWQGDRLRAHNLWRRLLLSYYSPQPGGKPFTGLIADGNWGSWMNAERHIQEINFWAENDLPMECYWVDAGWTDMSLGWEAHQSHQVPNPELFPHGIRPLADAAHQRGMKFLLWMVPESVHPAVGIGKEHPEWLGQPFGHADYGGMVFYGLDHGDPQVNQYMIEHFSKIVSDYGVDIFRQDGGNLWPEDTDPSRIGMSQIRYIQGFYEFWDGLLKNHPHLLIDNCAEGGRKIDLEAIRRSIVLWRSDYQAAMTFDPVVNQGYNRGLLPWIPLFGGVTPMQNLNAYSFRSAYSPAFLMGWPMAGVPDVKERWAKMDLNLLRNLLNEYLAIRPYLFGDFYPFTDYSLDQTVWAAWQFDRPDLGQGMVQAFRRSESPDESMRVRLYGLEMDAVYNLSGMDDPGSAAMTGRELMENGLLVQTKERPGSILVIYKKNP